MTFTVFHTLLQRCLTLFMALYFIAGCTSHPVSQLKNNQSLIRVSPLPDPGNHIQKKNFFFAEYLEKSKKGSRRATVLVDAAETPLVFLMNPERYIPGQTGAGSLSQIMKQFAPLKLFTLRSSTGKHMGYALLPPKQSLRSVHVNGKRHWLELSK